MKLAYGTYGMPEVPIWDAIPRLAGIGYEAVEICAADRWPTAPPRLDAADRERLRQMLHEHDLEMPGLLLFVNPLAPAGEELKQHEQRFREACILARQLAPGTAPTLASPLGACPLSWEEALPLLLERVARFAEIAGSEGCRFALEPHVHGP